VPVTLPLRAYGATGIRVSALGLGALQIGNPGLDEGTWRAVLDEVLDGGLNLIDSAPAYGLSEVRLGRWLRPHRDALVISTKLGYAVPGVVDWTGPCITAGVDRALGRLDTDRIDIAHLHSCPLDVLRRDDVIRALEDAKRAGKVRAIAYAGENEALRHAIDSGRFDGCMASLNLCDQRVVDETLPRLGGMGFIAKRPLANAPWRFAGYPHEDEARFYWSRWLALGLPDPGMPWGELAIRFAVWHAGVSAAVVGTANPEHLREDIRWSLHGPLPAQVLAGVRDAFRRRDDGWTGVV
jgi:aryl-alcohol dehydrogenase-like predicted oxidoreductase